MQSVGTLSGWTAVPPTGLDQVPREEAGQAVPTGPCAREILIATMVDRGGRDDWRKLRPEERHDIRWLGTEERVDRVGVERIAVWGR